MADLKKINCRYTEGNKDDIISAVNALNLFTHNWCMNCAETEKQNDIIFRCEECEFSLDDGRCLLKVFKRKHLPEFNDFGCMGALMERRERHEL